MKKIRCKFKGLSKKEEVKLKDQNCLILISVGQQSHEAERFSATVDLINEAGFKSCTISLYDSLQRYTMALGQDCSPCDLRKRAHSEGDLLLERNLRYIKKISSLNAIFRWDHWLNHIKFAQAKHQVNDLISKDSNYADSFNVAVEKYLTRYVKKTQLRILISVVQKQCAMIILLKNVLCYAYGLNCILILKFIQTHTMRQLFPLKSGSYSQ